MVYTSDCGPTFTAWRRTPFIYLEDTYNVPNSQYSIQLTSMNCTGAFSDIYNQITVYKDGVSIGSKSCYPFVAEPASCPTLFDSNKICISNGSMDCWDPNNCQYDIWYNEILPPGATHYIDYDFSILPQSFLDLVASNIVDLSNWLGTHLPMPSNIQWVSASYSTGKFRIYIIYTPPLPSAVQSLVSLPAMAIGTFAGMIAGLIVFAVAQRLTAVAGPIYSTIIGAALGIIAFATLGYVIYEIIPGTSTPGTAPPQTSLDKSKNIDDYIKNYVKPFCDSQHPGCAAVPATCDQATYRVYAACIQQVAQCQYDAAMKGDPVTTCDPRVQEYTAIDTGLANGTMTVAEAQQRTTTNNTTINNYHNEVINTLTCSSGQTYDLTTQKCIAAAGDCWIAGFVPGTCMLTAKTGKTIAIIGSVAIGGVILISLFKK